MHIFLSSGSGIMYRVEHLLGHTSRLNKFKKKSHKIYEKNKIYKVYEGIIQTNKVFSELNGMKL